MQLPTMPPMMSPPPVAGAAPPAAMAGAAALAGPTGDYESDLSNLIMAWYHCGFFTAKFQERYPRGPS